MVQQLQQTCPDCRGEGEVIREKDRCVKCHGSKICQEKKVLDVHIDKGMKAGQKIVFAGEGDQAPDIVPGDIIVTLQQKEHVTFKRDGGDLLMEHSLSLVEALCGFSFYITHLDGRVLHVKNAPGEVIVPNDIKCIDGEGMPTYKRPFEKGRLIIKFNVNFPKQLTPDAIKLLEKALPRPAAPKPARNKDEEVEEVTLTAFVANDGARQQHRHRGEAYEEDDDEHPQQGVSCSQQ
jgi:DnaJ family protein A protein 2